MGMGGFGWLLGKKNHVVTESHDGASAYQCTSEATRGKVNDLLYLPQDRPINAHGHRYSACELHVQDQSFVVMPTR